MSKLGNEFEFSLRTRKLIYSVNDAVFDILFKVASRIDVSKYVSENNIIRDIASLPDKLPVTGLFSLKSNKVR
ncbi:MAG TPA: hypothetical protein EYP86_00155 [Candidatus Altiarchaeales archaeon]|nr:hypothetical protein [Candidatus Altiarchaeales archaeon]